MSATFVKFLALGLALAHGAGGADGIVHAKDVVAGEVGTVTCNETVSGMLDADTDAALSDGVLVDVYRVDLPFDLEMLKVVRAESGEFDAELVVTSLGSGEVRADSDEGQGTDARAQLHPRSSGEHEIEVRGRSSDDSGRYELSVICADFPFDYPLPSGPEESWNYHFLWDGFYVEFDDQFRPASPGQGLAIEIQRGILFGALYGYDEAGEPTFLTLQSESVDDAGREFIGTVFETHSGTNTASVGTFRIELDARFHNFMKVTLDAPGHAIEDSTWGRFEFGAPSGLLLWNRSRMHFVIAATDPEQAEFLKQVGNTLDFLPTVDPFFAYSLFVAVPRDGFRASFSAQMSDSRFVIFIVSDDDRGDLVRLEVVGNHRGFIGQAMVMIDDEPGVPVDAVGVLARYDKP